MQSSILILTRRPRKIDAFCVFCLRLGQSIHIYGTLRVSLSTFSDFMTIFLVMKRLENWRKVNNKFKVMRGGKATNPKLEQGRPCPCPAGSHISGMGEGAFE